VAIREESYAEFSRRVHGRAAGKRAPVNIDYDVTYRCNLNCRHCYCNLPAGDREAKEKELPLNEIERILTEARDLGALWILLTGGEPLLRPDFKDIYLAVLRLGLIPSVFTNGTLVTEEWADFFAAHRPFRMEVTLYGSCAEVYERVTRTPGSFERCMQGIRLLKDRGLAVNLKTMALRSNYEDLEGIKAVARSMGSPYRLDPVIHPRYPDLPRPRDIDPRDERLPVEAVLDIDRADSERVEAWEGSCGSLRGLGPPGSGRLLSCGAGLWASHISADGTIRPCGMLRFMGWRGSFGSVWKEDMLRRLETAHRGPKECSECGIASLCGQCAGWAWLENRDLEAKVPHLCAIAHAREEAFSLAR